MDSLYNNSPWQLELGLFGLTSYSRWSFFGNSVLTTCKMPEYWSDTVRQSSADPLSIPLDCANSIVFILLINFEVLPYHGTFCPLCILAL